MTIPYNIGNAPFEDYFIRKELFSTGGLWTWGQNYVNAGQLGDNTTVNKSSPIQTIAGGTNWKSVSGGGYHTAAIKTDGTLWTWGASWYGMLGDNTSFTKSSPIQTVAGGTNWKLVSGNNYTTAAIKTDGTLWLWGLNHRGELGDETINNKFSPIQTVAGGTNWKSVSGSKGWWTGGVISAIKTDGTLWLWGYNGDGQLGTNDTIHRSSPVQTVAGGTNWKLVSGGGYHTAAIKTDGTLWTWGYNGDGQLGTNDIINKSSPVQTVAGGTNWKSVSSGVYHTAAIKTDGTLWTWGYNTYGQLGDNTITRKSSPIQTVAGGTNWKSVSCNLYFTAAIKTDGTLWTWGNNEAGQLGDNTTVNKLSPVQTVAGGTNWKSVSCGLYYMAAIRDDS